MGPALEVHAPSILNCFEPLLDEVPSRADAPPAHVLGEGLPEEGPHDGCAETRDLDARGRGSHRDLEGPEVLVPEGLQEGVRLFCILRLRLCEVVDGLHLEEGRNTRAH